MAVREAGPERVGAFSDGVFAVIITVGVFTMAGVAALWWPLLGMALICRCLIGYLRPDVPTLKKIEA